MISRNHPVPRVPAGMLAAEADGGRTGNVLPVEPPGPPRPQHWSRFMSILRPRFIAGLAVATAAFAAPLAAAKPAPAPAPAPGTSPGGPVTGAETIDRLWEGTRTALTAPPADLMGMSDEAAGGPSGLGPLPEATAFSIEEAPDGDIPIGLAYGLGGTRLLSVNRDSDNVTIYDATTLDAIATVPVGDFPVSIATTPDGATAVVTNLNDNTVSIIDVASAAVTATVPVSGAEPFAVRITGDGSRAVVAVINDAITSQFSIIDLGTQTEVAAVPVGGMGAIGFAFRVETAAFLNFFTDFALTDAGLATCYDRANDTVYVVDVMTGSLVGSALVPDGPDAVDVTPDGTLAVFGCDGAEQLAVVDLATASVANVFSVPAFNNRLIKVTPDGQEAAFFADNFIVFADLATGTASGFIDHGFFIKNDLEITPDGQSLVVGSSRARVIDIATKTESALIVAPLIYNLVPGPSGSTLAGTVALDDQLTRITANPGQVNVVARAGEPAEGDDPFAVDIAPGGDLAVIGNLTSGNAAVMELPSGNVRSWIDCGTRIKRVAISPDGTKAIVLAMDSNAIVVIDLTNDTVIGTLFVSNRPGRVRFSPDSSEAYVLNIAGTDRVSFITLDGTPQIVAQLSAGQTGAANGPTFTELSGVSLSADGSTFAVCDSFNDALRLYDTATRTQIASVPTGDFPLHVAFTPDGTKAYVTNHFGDSVTVISVNGGASAPITTITGFDRYPLEVVASADGSRVFVATRNSNGGNDAVTAIDTATDQLIDVAFAFEGYPRTMDMADDGTLRVATTGGTLVEFPNASNGLIAGTTTVLPNGPKDLAHDDVSDRAMVVGPGLDVASYIGDAAPACIFDLDASGDVGFQDLTSVLAGWGQPGPADFDGDGAVDLDDLLSLLANWGPCS